MKISQLCSKCHSSDIVRIPGTNQGHGFGNNIKTGITVFNAILVTRYLCCNCGFIEEWVDNPQDIVKIKAYYTR